MSFSGLSMGRHAFRYRLDDAFFACFPEGDIRQAELAVDLVLERTERLMRLHFDFQGWFKTVCDRCLNELNCPVSFQDEVIVRFTGEADEREDEDNLWWVEEHQDKLDLSQYFYDTVVLQRPIQLFCPEDEHGRSTCNAAMAERVGAEEKAEPSGALSEDNLAVLRALKKEV